MLSANQNILTAILVIGLCCGLTNSLTVFAPVNGNGIRGTVTWIQEGLGSKVTVLISLEALHVEPIDYSWIVREFPVHYGLNPDTRCDQTNLGAPIVKLDDIFGKLTIPSESTISLTTEKLNLTGSNGIWSHSLVLISKGQSTCATIDAEGEIRLGLAHFTHPMAGTITFQSLNDPEGLTTVIYSDIFHVNQDRPAASDHVWKLFITDAGSNVKDETDCNILQSIWDPDGNQGNPACSKSDHDSCPSGDMTGKHGKLRIGVRQSIFSKKTYTDVSLPMIPYEGRRKLFVAIFHPDKSDTIVGCARIQKIYPRNGISFVNGYGAKVNFTFVQNSPFHPTTIYITARNLESRAGNFRIHIFPKLARLKIEDAVCSGTGSVWNPYQVNVADYPEPESGTDDYFELGDLSGKYGRFIGLDNVSSQYTDGNLPLFGPQSILGRSIVIERESDGGRWICGNIEGLKEMTTAVATFRYPLVGSIYFMQQLQDPFSETSIFVDGLHYSDGSKNNTLDHQWAIHTGEITKDFFDWKNRCLSADVQFNPHKVSMESRGYSDCGPSSPFRCSLGDLSTRLQRISISGTGIGVPYTRRYFTTLNLPLIGKNGIIGRSIVLFDLNFPIHRGERLACTMIERVYRVKAVAKDWFPNNGGGKVSVTGKLEFLQETPFSPVKTHVMLKGLNGIAKNYRIHQTTIPIDRTDPCSEHSVGLTFNPFNITKPPLTGSQDQFAVGDLSGKFGILKDRHEFEGEYNDTNIEIVAPHSILGRSVVVSRDKDARLVCSDVVRGYSPSEASEYRAIASFHHPDGYAWGYVRFSQLVYNDGSLSDTVIEVNLKYPGQINRDVTKNHKWSIYVNRIAHDAAVRSLPHRCVAAGIIWNPYYIHLADPNNHEFYRQECGPNTPLRCFVGDISGRLGPISIGANKFVFVDPNLPLSGPGSVLGRSLVIHPPNFGEERFACANIDPDKDIIKYANIRKLNSFLLEEFMDDIRKVLGVPEWMLTYDSRQTKEVHDGECIQLLFHFKGPIADKIEQDFDRLINGREIFRPSLEILGVLNPVPRKTKLPYRSCSIRRTAKKQLDYTSSTSSHESLNRLLHYIVTFGIALLQITTFS